jgi:hypothetical protein
LLQIKLALHNGFSRRKFLLINASEIFPFVNYLALLLAFPDSLSKSRLMLALLLKKGNRLLVKKLNGAFIGKSAAVIQFFLPAWLFYILAKRSAYNYSNNTYIYPLYCLRYNRGS